MFEFFEKKISAAFKTFDKGFKEAEEALDSAADEMKINSEAFLKSGKRMTMSSRSEEGSVVEQETVVEETKPDGTKVVTRTIVRTYGKST